MILLPVGVSLSGGQPGLNYWSLRTRGHFNLATLLTHMPKLPLETFMGGEQRTGAGSLPRIPCVVSKSDRDHRSATTAYRSLGLTPTGTICCSNLFLGLYPILSTFD